MSDYAVFPVPSQQIAQKVDVTTTSAQSTALPDNSDVAVIVTALCFVSRGQNPTAVANTSLALAPNVPYRLKGIRDNEKLAFVTATGTATAYLCPVQ